MKKSRNQGCVLTTRYSRRALKLRLQGDWPKNFPQTFESHGWLHVCLRKAFRPISLLAQSFFGGSCCFTALLCCSLPLHASFIESTIGTAVVDDATATYYNPAALTLLKKKQVIALGAIGNTQTQFNGQSTQFATGYIESGLANKSLNYLLPSFYFGMPASKNIFIGLAVVANNFNSNIDDHSILRYAQSNNQTQDIDIIPAIGIKLNKYLSLGAGLNGSRAHFLLEPISGSPSANIPDAQSHNDSWGNALGGDIGLLLKPSKTTIFGFNYRNAMTYGMRGKSTYNGYSSSITSDNYHFNYWTPARSVVSVNHFITPRLGLIGTVQYIQWSIFKDIILHDLATSKGIVSTASAPYNLRDSWLFTIGSNYRISSKWIIRAAGSYSQKPSKGNFQIDLGDSITIGASMGYQLFKNTIIDCSYAHSFIQDQTIQATTLQNSINGTNSGTVNGFALKLTLNV